jgi:hypothetical protein
MPKRIVDGESLWRSDKLAEVQPEKFRAEFANLIPLAYANGTFECNPKRIWSIVYSYNRPSYKVTDVENMLKDYERVKLLFRWIGTDGKVWGHWVGMDKPGRLPAPSRKEKEKMGEPVPRLLLKQFLAGDIVSGIGLTEGYPQGSKEVAEGDHGFGFGFGEGLGFGSGLGEGSSTSLSLSERADLAFAEEGDD